MIKVLIVCRYKEYFPSHIMPFITEQADALVKNGNCEVEYFTVKGKGLLSYFTQVKFLKRKIAEFNPDIVHAHYGLSGFTAVMQRKVPVVITFHNGEVDSFAGNLLSSIASLLAKHTIYVAQHIYDRTFFKSKTKYSIIPCGVPLEQCVVTCYEKARRELGFSDDKRYILFGGAFDNLRKNYPLIKDALLLSGRECVTGKGYEDFGDIVCLEMKGLSREECVLRMCACDLFALPSKSEGSPQALKEAMACGCPVMATDIADIKHLLGDLPGHYICTFDAANVVSVLDEALTFNGRTDGRKRIEELRLDNSQVALQIENIYKHILTK